MDHLGLELKVQTVDFGRRIIVGFAAAHDNEDRVRDIIEPGASVKATRRLAQPGQVSVYIGHPALGSPTALPVGVPLRIEATPQGLLTETEIFEGPVGDNLLHVAQGLQRHGQALGLSIGYRTRDHKMERGPQGFRRRILDYDLREYSFAGESIIANPQALAIGMKAMGDGMGTKQADTEDVEGARVEQRPEGWVVLDAEDGDVVGTFATEAEAQAFAAGWLAGSTDEEAEGEGDEGKTAVKAVWTTAAVNNLPNSAFLLVEPGDDDGDGKRVPRAKRHFPYRGPGGAVDLPHLRNAIARIPQADLPGFDDAAKARLQARARRLLEQAQGGSKTADLGWGDGTAVDARAAGYALLDLSEAITRDHAAMAVLGLDTKAGRAMSQGNLGQLHRAMQEQQRLHAAVCDMGADCPLQSDGAKALALYRRRLQLLEV